VGVQRGDHGREGPESLLRFEAPEKGRFVLKLGARRRPDSPGSDRAWRSQRRGPVARPTEPALIHPGGSRQAGNADGTSGLAVCRE